MDDGRKRPLPPDAKRCRATNRNRERCKRWRSPGAVVCVAHGAAAPQAKAKAAERVVEEHMRAAFGNLTDRSVPVTDAWGEYERLAGDVVAWKNFAAEQIADLERLRTIGDLGVEQVDARVSVFERALAQCTTTLGQLAKLNIEDRRARFDERRADAIVRAVAAGLRAGGVTEPEQLDRARAAAVRELRAV